MISVCLIQSPIILFRFDFVNIINFDPKILISNLFLVKLSYFNLFSLLSMAFNFHFYIPKASYFYYFRIS